MGYVLLSATLKENVQAFGFDTTASNTGRLKGAGIILEQNLERDILYFDVDITCLKLYWQQFLQNLNNYLKSI